MNQRLHIGMLLFFSVLMTSFIFAGIVFIPSVRSSIGNFLVSYRDQPASVETLTADTLMATNPSVPAPLPSLQLASPTPIDPTIANTAGGDITMPKSYEYKLLRSVDICQLNTLGAQGFQAIQFGGNIDTSSGRDATCKSYHMVDVLDWVLFVREK